MGGIKTLVILFFRLLEDGLWCDEATGYKMPKPVCDVNDIVVAFLFVHGGRDLVKLGIYVRVVALPPVQ